MGENRDDIMRWVCEMALSDSQAAFKSLYMAYFGRLTRFTGLYVSSPAEAEEIVSDTFLAIWDNRGQLPAITNFDSYIYTVARHKAISYYRKQHMEKISLDEISIDLFTSTETTPEEDLISQEGIKRLNMAIESLPAKCKVAFKLVREDKLKYKDVAAILDISVKTLEAHLANAVRKLRETLAEDTCS
ncbi:RNA polymerase sigma-70 factor [uncultured Parabacteroides sp.]|uniref:RNA polymerase sigma-70 factor n=1 Tax=uncultured Parabacteroides sp. TaxID=512312 RepID=UPI0025F46069|nr:RNA polymerase sigma-70 factor [uncultured Parabacteroides sp.]